jgi:WD40 repeat protein
MLATGGADGTGTLWAADTGRPNVRLRASVDGVEAMTFSPDARTVVTASPGELRVWSIRTGRALSVIRNDALDGMVNAAFEQGGRLLLAASTEQVRVFDVRSRRPTETIDPPLPIAAAAFDSSGARVLIVTEDETVRLRDASQGTDATLVPGHPGAAVLGAQITTDGKLAVTTEPDAVRLWELATGQPLAVLSSAGRELFTSALLSPAGRDLVVAATSGRLRVYDCEVCAMNLSQLAERARSELTRPLTVDERTRFIPRAN